MSRTTLLRRRRALFVAPLAAATLAMGGLAVQPLANAGPGTTYYPDLRADPPENISSPSIVSNPYAGANRLIVRFDGFVTNVGRGPLRIEGNPQPGGGIAQKVRTSNGGSATTPVANPEVRFESADGHNHFHLMQVMRYSLWNEDRTAQAAPAGKVGFCLYDSEPAANPVQSDPQNWTVGAPGDTFCQSPDDGGAGSSATSLDMGVSAGWRDVYDQSLTFQWVDVTNTAPGLYWVAAEADPDNRIRESNENNPIAFGSTPVIVPGFTPQPVGVATGQSPVNVTLQSKSFGGASALAYRIESPPKNGTLSVAPGTDFTNPTLTYTPNAGFSGADSFTYSARDTFSPYPQTPPLASVTIAVSGPGGTASAVGISGAPTALFAGTSAKLRAQVVGLSNKRVRWSVNGVRGGNRKVGTITASGLYIAPSRVPAGGRVNIRATSVANGSRFGQVSIRIRKAPQGLPLPGSAVAGRKGTFPVPGMWVRKQMMQVATFTRRTGIVRVRVFNGSKRIRTCTAKLRAGQGYVCNVAMKRGYNKKKLRAIATLKSPGKRVITKVVGPTRIGAAAVSRRGTRRVVRVKPLRSGRLTVVVADRRGVIKRCRVKALARTGATCRFRYRGSPVKATIALRTFDGFRAIARRRAA